MVIALHGHGQSVMAIIVGCGQSPLGAGFQINMMFLPSRRWAIAVSMLCPCAGYFAVNCSISLSFRCVHCKTEMAML